MRVVLQRAKTASVTVNGETVGAINNGLVLLVGVKQGDNQTDIDYVANKVAGLRIFENDEGKMDQSVMDVGGSILSISQFTLYGDVKKGKRPNFMAAAKPVEAKACYEAFNEALRNKGLTVATGQFGEMMDVSLVNDGPVTLIVESKD